MFFLGNQVLFGYKFCNNYYRNQVIKILFNIYYEKVMVKKMYVYIMVKLFYFVIYY